MKLKAFSLIAVISAMCAWGAPSRMRPVTAVDPSGRAVTVIPVGDEHHHYYVDENGKKVEWLKSVDRPKSTPAMQKRVKDAQSGRVTSFPTNGKLPFLIVLVDFADKSFDFNNPAEEFSAMLSEPGFSRYNGCGSALDYYRDNSAGAFIPEFDVVGPVTMSRGYAYYGGGSDDSQTGYMVIEACQSVDPYVDFSKYDLDGDGEVDNVYFFYAGMGEADGGDANTIWPHAWTLTEQGRSLQLDGVKIDAYACSPELDGQRKPNGIGTFCHEFAHILGLPDLYASSYTGALHPETWSLMASGNYNEDGRRPPCLSSYERYELGWISPRELSYPLTVSLNPISENEACRISTERVNEYFLFENRQNEGWDLALPGHGMLVWHIDYNPNIWDRNVVNNTPSHQYVDIVEANNATSHSQDAGFTFPGRNNVTSFTADTRPALRSWAGIGIDLPITDIKESSNGIISFNVAGGKAPVGTVTGLKIDEVGMESCSLSWQEVPGAESYHVSVVDNDGGAPFSFETDTENKSVELTGLWPGREYLASVCAQDKYERGEFSTIVITMPQPDFFHIIPEMSDATDVTATSFTASWSEVEGATSYLLSVSKVCYEVDRTDSFGFDNLVLSDGWTMTGCAWSSIEGYFGQNAPSLRMSGDGASLSIPSNGVEISMLRFYAKGSSKSVGSSIDIYGANVEGTMFYIGCAALGPDADVIDIDVPANVFSLSLKLSAAQSSVVAYIDDIEITYAHRADVTVDSWDKKDVGNVTSCRIDNLEPDILYSCRVTPLSDGQEGLTSEEYLVSTSKDSSVGRPVTADESVNVYNGLGVLLKKDVDRKDAAAGLPAGFYIIGNQKVFITD